MGRDFAGVEDLNFGFGFTSFGNAGFDVEELEISVDNFQVTINSVPENSVPEPSSLLMLGGVGIATLARRRRKSIAE